MKRFAFLTIFLLCLSLLGFSTDYYVKNAGDDSKSGLDNTNAWKTIAKVNSVSFSAGDNIYFNKGDEWVGDCLEITNSGSSGSVITFGAYGTGNDPIINGATATSTWVFDSTVGSREVYTKTVSNTPYVVIEDDTFLTFLQWDTNVATTFIGASAGSWVNNGLIIYIACTDDLDPDTHTMEVAAEGGIDRNGIYALNVSYVTIDGIKVQYTTQSAIYFSTNSGTDSNNIVKNCTVFLIGQHGIRIKDNRKTAYNIVTSCTVDTNTVSYARRHGIVFANGVSDGTIKNNTSHHCGWGGTGVGGTGGHNISLWGDDATGNPRNNIIEKNTAYNCFIATDGTEGNGIQADDFTKDCTYRYNISYDNEGSGLCDNGVSGQNWYFNLSYGNGSGSQSNFAGGMMASQGNDLEVYNNTFYDNEPCGFGHFGTSVSYTLKNNIFSENDTYEIRFGVNGDIGETFDYNCVYHSAGGSFMRTGGASRTWAGWTGQGYDANGVNDNPDFTTPGSDFTLQTGSPCIDVGVDVSLTVDIAGTAIPLDAGFDIGAYEYGSAPPPNVYIDSGAAGGGDGSLATPWDALADIVWVDLQTVIDGGDPVSVNLKRGSTFNEDLIVQAYGTSSDSITIQVYDSGAKPTLNATEITQTTWVVADDPSTDNQLTNGQFTSNTTGWTAGNNATLSSESGGQSGNCLQILCDGSNNPRAIQSTGKGVAAGDRTQAKYYVKSGTEATWKFYVWDDDNNAYLDSAANAEADANWDTRRNSGPWTLPSGCENVELRLQQTAIAGAATTLLFDEVILYNPDIYKKTISPAPSVVKEDGAALTFVAWDTDMQTTLEGQGSGVWTKSGTTVWVRCTDDADPDTHTMTAFGLYAIDGGGNDYVIFKNLDVNDGTIANLLLDGDNCEVADCDFTDGIDGVVISGASNSFHRSTITGADSEALKVTGNNNSIYYNKIYTNSDDGVNNSGTGNTFYNLVVYGSGAAAFDIDETCTIRNCIDRTTTGDSINIAAGKTVTGGYNCFEDAAKAGTGTYTDTATSTKFSTNPVFTTDGSDFTLQSTSPCIDTGLDVGLVLDYNEDTVPYVNVDCTATPDMGAYESVFCIVGTPAPSAVDDYSIDVDIDPDLSEDITVKVIVIIKKKKK